MAYARVDSTKLQARVSDLADAAAKRAAFQIARRARASILGQRRIDTHEMIRSYKTVLQNKSSSRVTYRLSNTARHYVFQELGTGNPPGIGRIYPAKAKALRFRPKGSKVFVFAKSVRGVKPGEFLKRAIAVTTVKDFGKRVAVTSE